jgi:hypothetical protein
MLLGIKLPPIGKSSPTAPSSLFLSPLLIQQFCHPIIRLEVITTPLQEDAGTGP